MTQVHATRNTEKIVDFQQFTAAVCRRSTTTKSAFTECLNICIRPDFTKSTVGIYFELP